jgi:hypothetical protein
VIQKDKIICLRSCGTLLANETFEFSLDKERTFFLPRYLEVGINMADMIV